MRVPSGKSLERNLLDEETLRHNQEAIRRQLSRLIDFDSSAPNAAVLVNNYDWMKGMGFLEFIRDIGKHITVNYMMAKDSVKKRFNGEGDGMSFTEFTYQLVQGYDFMQLYRNYDCRLQLGGSDQWGNITTGVELIRRIEDGQVYGMTCPLIKKADGTKFGKTESGNVWLDARYTSPYKFYQFWLNVSDEDAKSYIRIFTFLDRETIEALVAEHEAAPHERRLQKTLARELTCMIHSREEYDKAVEASAILFGGATAEALHRLDEQTLLQVFDGVPQSAGTMEMAPLGQALAQTPQPRHFSTSIILFSVSVAPTGQTYRQRQSFVHRRRFLTAISFMQEPSFPLFQTSRQVLCTQDTVPAPDLPHRQIRRPCRPRSACLSENFLLPFRTSEGENSEYSLPSLPRYRCGGFPCPSPLPLQL